MTSPAPAPEPTRPAAADSAALYDAVADEHATIYGYGIVSAHITPDVNALVSEAIAGHRAQREKAIHLLASRGTAPPLPAAGYQLPFAVTTPTDAANLAVRMENDAAVAWRAVLEQAVSSEDRGFAVAALTQSAILAARWRQVLKAWPVTEAFPGGSE